MATATRVKMDDETKHALQSATFATWPAVAVACTGCATVGFITWLDFIDVGRAAKRKK